MLLKWTETRVPALKYLLVEFIPTRLSHNLIEFDVEFIIFSVNLKDI